MEAAGGAGVRDGDRHVAGEGAIDGELREYGAGTSDGSESRIVEIVAHNGGGVPDTLPNAGRAHLNQRGGKTRPMFTLISQGSH